MTIGWASWRKALWWCLLLVLVCMPAGIASAGVVQLLLNSDDCLLVLTEEQGLYRECPGDLRPRWQAELPERPAAVTETGTGQRWLATRRGLLRQDHPGGDWVPVATSAAAWVRCDAAHCAVKFWGRGLYRLERGEIGRVTTEGLPPAPVQDALVQSDGSWIAAAFGKGVYRLGLDSQRWEPLHAGLDNRHVLALAASPESSLYAATFGGGLYRLDPGQQAWTRLENLPATDITAIAVASDGHILLGTRRQGLWWSTDAGSHWFSDSGVDGLIVSVALGPAGLGWAADDAGELYRLSDAQWRRVAFRDGFTTRAVAVDEEGTIVILQGRTLFRTRYPANDWTVVAAPPALDAAAERVAMTFAPSGDLYLGAWNRGLYLARDAGGQWREAADGLPGPPGTGVRTLRVAPNGDLLAVANDHGHSAFSVPRGSYRQEDYRPSDYRIYRLRGPRWEPLFKLGQTPGDEAVNGIGLLPDWRLLAWGRNAIGIADGDLAGWRVVPLRDMAAGPPQITADGAIWVDRGRPGRSEYWVLHPGETDWAGPKPRPDERFHGFLPVNGGDWLALTPQGRLARLRHTSEGLSVLAVHAAPMPLERFAANAAGQVVAGARDRVFLSGDGGATWNEITP